MAFQGERGKRRRRRQTELQNGNKYCTILITHILRQRLAVFSELKGKSSGRCRVSCGGGGTLAMFAGDCSHPQSVGWSIVVIVGAAVFIFTHVG